jgi:hypothetical protein
VSVARGMMLGALLLAGCIKVNPADGAFVCGPASKCPDGYYCAGNNTCWHMGHAVNLDMSMPDLLQPSCAATMSCMVNQACKQASDCATGSCSNGFCQLVSDSPKWIAMSVAPLAGPRAESAGFVTSDGRLVIVSGLSASSTVTDAVIDYKIGSGASKSYTALPNPRYGHTGSLGSDGRFYVMGGCRVPNCATPTNLVDAFDYTANTWSSPAAPAALNVARRHAASAYAGGKLWIFGGYDGSKVLGSVEVYNPGAPDSWTQIAPVLPTPRTGLAAVTGADGRVYTIGGGDSTFTVAPSLEIFDPKTMTWSTGANMSMGRIAPEAVLAPDGRIYAMGGAANAGTFDSVPTVEAYTPATNTWAAVAQLNMPRLDGLALVGPDNRIYVMGGYVAPGADMGTSYLPSTMVEVYGPAMAVAPGTGTAGATNVSITGSNFAANAVVDIFFGDRASAPVASGNSDGNGNISVPINFIIPANAMSGSAKIFAVDRKSQYPAVTTFAVQ